MTARQSRLGPQLPAAGADNLPALKQPKLRADQVIEPAWGGHVSPTLGVCIVFIFHIAPKCLQISNRSVEGNVSSTRSQPLLLDSTDPNGPMRIALVGTRGVPAKYGGFETAVEEVASASLRADTWSRSTAAAPGLLKRASRIRST